METKRIEYTAFSDAVVEERYLTYPAEIRVKLLDLRELIFAIAAKTAGVGKLEEALKWNEPSFLTTASKSGSTIRIDWKERDPDRLHVYLSCNTQLIRFCRELFPDPSLHYEGKRTIAIKINDPLPIDSLEKCLEMALTYHLRNYKDEAVQVKLGIKKDDTKS